MNTLVRTQGYVTDAHALEPYAKHSYDIKRYELHLCPSDCTHFYDLEHRVEELKREYEQQQPYDSHRYSNHDTHLALKDRVLTGDPLTPLAKHFIREIVRLWNSTELGITPCLQRNSTV